MGIDGTDIPSVYHKYHLSNHPAALFKGHIILSLRGKVIQYVILVQWYLLQAVAQEITSKIAAARDDRRDQCMFDIYLIFGLYTLLIEFWATDRPICKFHCAF